MEETSDNDSDETMISEREAEKILEDARAKDFWTVDFDYDNKDTLRRAVDRIFNTVPGNNYEVDYMISQNGTRLMVRCVPCDKELLSFDPFTSHDRGKPHKKIRQQNLQSKTPNLTRELQRQPLNLSKYIFEEDSLEEMVDLCEDTVLGIQFVYKEVFMDREKFTCTLCRLKRDTTAIKKSEMFKHLRSHSHNLTYMEVKFGYQNYDFSTFIDYARNIEVEIEGKIHGNIVDFSKQMLAKLGPSCVAKIKKERESPKRKRRKRHHKRKCRYNSSSTDSCCDSHRSTRSPSPGRLLSHVKSEPPTIPSLPLFQPPLMVDKSANVTIMNKLSASENLRLLQRADVMKLIEEDICMQTLLHEMLLTCNRNLKHFFRDREIICFDEKGNIVTEAAKCASNLEKHLDQLTFIDKH